jgi:C4-dicarboxylate-specific signal transduction histidine kinase
MTEELRRRLREEELAFFGRIGADVSHEMRNVLSVIGEYAGLLDDLLAHVDDGSRLDCEKLKQLSAKITRQIRKGTEAMERFSRFAHATDEQAASFDLTELTRNMAALAERHVTRAGCRLETDLPKSAISVRSEPFTLQQTIFSAIELILEFLEKGALVTLRLVAQGRTAMILISGTAASGGGDQLSGRISQLSAAMNELKGSVETSRSDGTISLILTLPAK